jgi:hypothetical protein
MIKKYTWIFMTLFSYTILNVGILLIMFSIYPPRLMLISQTNNVMMYSGVGVTCSGIVGSILSVLALMS